MSIRSSDLSRWPLPPTSSPQEKVRLCLPLAKEWPVMPIHNQWLIASAEKYGFDGVDEVLRHLIYTANAEPKPVKKLIFKTIRCLHCHVGARADQHEKILLGTTATEPTSAATTTTNIRIHTFHYEWLLRVTESCKIASVEKCVRIILDYYQSRVKQVFHADGAEAAAKKESELFGNHRHEDPRWIAILEEQQEQQEQQNHSLDDTNESSSNDDDNCPDDNDILRNDPSACSPEEMIKAIQRCQVGRNSASYAVAMKETPEETKARRARELLVETSEETKKAREQIRKALGSPMG